MTRSPRIRQPGKARWPAMLLLLGGCAEGDDLNGGLGGVVPDTGDSATTEACLGSEAAWLLGTPYTEIQEALDAATTNDEVLVCPGSWTENLVIDRDITLTGQAGSASTTIRARAAGPVVLITTGRVAVRDLTLAGGTGTQIDDNTVGGVMAAIQFQSLHLSSCILEEGQASFGGALGVLDGEAVVLEDVILRNSTATSSGGGLYMDAVTADLYGTAVTGNLARWGGGGAAFESTVNAGAGTVFSDNQAEENGGGAIVMSAVWIGGELTDNLAETGGGAHLDRDATLQDVLITSNRATQFGGGVRCDKDCTLVGLEIRDNDGGSFGGGILLDGAGASWTVASTTATGNNATSGGGLYTEDGTATLDDLTLSTNTAASGGGAYLEGQVFGSNLDVSGNSASLSGGGVILGAGQLEGGEISGNDAGYGGGLYVTFGGSVEGARISDNEATVYGAGAICDQDDCSFLDVVVANNVSYGWGGGLMVNGGTTVMDGGRISSNLATEGGGAAVLTSGTLVLDTVDLGAGNDGNGPDDIGWVDQDTSYNYNDIVSVTCAQQVCE